MLVSLGNFGWPTSKHLLCAHPHSLFFYRPRVLYSLGNIPHPTLPNLKINVSYRGVKGKGEAGSSSPSQTTVSEEDVSEDHWA